MNVKSFLILIVGAAVAFGHSRSVSTQPAPADRYLITDLGTLGGGRSDALAIDELGRVAGSAERSDGSTHAFFFDRSMHDLGTIGGVNSAATGVNQKGQIVGWSESAIGNIKGFIYSDGVRRSFGTLGGSNSAAYGINNFGAVVGSATTAGNAATRAFLYRNGAMKSLGTLGGINSAATAISDGDDITGWSSIAGNGAVHAFLSLFAGPMIDIGTLGGDSQGLDVEGDTVVGRSVVASGAAHAFLYTGGTMIDLGTLGGRNSEATSISQTGQIVGTSELAGGAGTHAFSYGGGVMTDLNARVPAGSGWVLETAAAVDFGGDVVGVGTINGQRHAYRLSLRVPVTLFPFGRYSEEGSNFPPDGIQVGRAVHFVSTVHVTEEGNALNIVYTDTLEGPLEVQSANIFITGEPCAVSGRVVTCRLPALGPWSKLDEEISIFARVTAPGPVSHTAHVTADNTIPNADDTLIEHNRGIALESFTLSAATVAGGKSVSARAELTSLPSPGGAQVRVESSDPTIAPVPSPLVVQGASAVRTFNIIPPVVSRPTTVTVTATYGLVTIAQTLTVVPPSLTVLSLTRSTMIGACQTASAKVTLNGSAPPGGASVTLSATTPGVHIPATVTIGAGETNASVTVTADAVHTLSKGVFTAAFGGSSKELPFAVRPIYLTAVTLSPSSVTGGSPSTGTATIECAAPPGGVVATVTSTRPAAAMPAAGSVSFAAGSTTRSFTVRTSPVGSVTTPAIRVTVNGVTKSAALEVKP